MYAVTDFCHTIMAINKIHPLLISLRTPNTGVISSQNDHLYITMAASSQQIPAASPRYLGPLGKHPPARRRRYGNTGLLSDVLEPSRHNTPSRAYKLARPSHRAQRQQSAAGWRYRHRFRRLSCFRYRMCTELQRGWDAGKTSGLSRDETGRNQAH